MLEFLKKHRLPVIIFAAALGIRIFAMLSFESEKSLLYVSDSYTYLSVAQNLIDHGIYSMERADPPTPDNFRTPLYPFFLTPFVAMGASIYLAVILQNLIFSFAAVCTFLLAQRLWSTGVAFVGTLLFVLEPITALISAQVMTEPLFLSFFVPAVLLFSLAVKEAHPRYALFGALLLGLAALTRPVAFYLCILIPLALILAGWKPFPWRKIAAGILTFFLVLSPWLLFTTLVVKTPDFSSLSSFDLYAYHGRLFDEWREKRGVRTESDRLPVFDYSPIDATFDAEVTSDMRTIGLRYIFSHPFEYAFFHLLRMPRLFTDSGYVTILNGFSPSEVGINAASGGFLDTLLSKRAGALIRQTLETPALGVLLLADLFFILCALGAFLHLLLYRKQYGALNKVSLFLIIILGLYTFLASPIGGPRLRIPLNAILFFLAADTVRILIQIRRERHKHATA